MRLGREARPRTTDPRRWFSGRTGVEFFPAFEVHEKGIAPVVDAIEPGADVFVTIDLDGLDPSIMPAVYVPAPGGLMYWQVVRLVDAVVAKARLRAMAILELVPDNDPERLSALTAGRMPATRSGGSQHPTRLACAWLPLPERTCPGGRIPGLGPTSLSLPAGHHA